MSLQQNIGEFKPTSQDKTLAFHQNHHRLSVNSFLKSDAFSVRLKFRKTLVTRYNPPNHEVNSKVTMVFEYIRQYGPVILLLRMTKIGNRSIRNTNLNAFHLLSVNCVSSQLFNETLGSKSLPFSGIFFQGHRLTKTES